MLRLNTEHKWAGTNYSAIIMTVALGAVYFVSKKIIRNGISPIILICIAGIAGIFVFGR